nr:lipoprotein [Shewanella sp. SR44-3]
MRLILLMILASLFLSACGQKGPLYKSPEPEANQSQAEQKSFLEKEPIVTSGK